MNIMKSLIAAAVVAVPAFFAAAPAQAITARQYQAQGHGRYISSTGGPSRAVYGRGHHRSSGRHHRLHR